MQFTLDTRVLVIHGQVGNLVMVPETNRVTEFMEVDVLHIVIPRAMAVINAPVVLCVESKVCPGSVPCFGCRLNMPVLISRGVNLVVDLKKS